MARATRRSLAPLAVDVGRIEQHDAVVDGLADRRDRLVVVSATVGLRHPHAAKALRGQDQSGGAELAASYDILSHGPLPGHAVARTSRERR